MIKKDGVYVVMGLLDPDSIAFAVGQDITRLGGKVIYTAQNERMKGIFFDRSKKLGAEDKAGLHFEYCDVTIEEQVKALFEKIGPIDGVVHSIGYANPKTALGQEFHTDAIDDLKLAFHISCVSLATVTRHAYKQMKAGGSVVTLTFESQKAFAYYNWMGVNKAALEALVRALARRHGATMLRGAEVQAISRDGDTWRVETSKGPITARRILNCAGAWALDVARRFGDDAPLDRIHRELKAAFDPDRVFNRGRLYPEL